MKLWYLRADVPLRPRRRQGRYREHWQFGVEAIGSDDAAVDAEVIALQAAWYRALGLGGLELRAELDRRRRPAGPPTATLLVGVPRRAPRRARRRLRRARLDATRCASSTRKDGRDQTVARGRARASPTTCATRARAHFAERARATSTRAASPTASTPRLVRGLDYYTRTAWECHPGAAGAQATISGGGRYDGLAELIGGPRTPGRRLRLRASSASCSRSRTRADAAGAARCDWFFAVLDDDAARPRAAALLERRARGGLRGQSDSRGRSLKRAKLRHADGRARRQRRRRGVGRAATASVCAIMATGERRSRRRCRATCVDGAARTSERLSGHACGEPRRATRARADAVGLGRPAAGPRRPHLHRPARPRRARAARDRPRARARGARDGARRCALECVVRARGELVARAARRRATRSCRRRRRARASTELEMLSSSAGCPSSSTTRASTRRCASTTATSTCAARACSSCWRSATASPGRCAASSTSAGSSRSRPRC